MIQRARVIGFLRENWLGLLLPIALLVAFVVLRSSPTDLADAAQFDALLTDGQPTVVEFYSNY